MTAVVDIEVAGVAPRPGRAAVVDLARLGAALAGGDHDPGGAARAAGSRSRRRRRDLRGRSRRRGPAGGDRRGRRGPYPSDPLFRPADARGTTPASASRRSIPAIVEGRATLDLGRSVVATRAVALAARPLPRGARPRRGHGRNRRAHRPRRGAPLPTGRRRLTIDAGVRRPLAGPLALGATLSFPPRPPSRAHELRRDFELPADGIRRRADGAARGERAARLDPRGLRALADA